MEDTPSNYNIPNGRLDGRSLGLKAILLHERRKNKEKEGSNPRTNPLTDLQKTLQPTSSDKMSNKAKGQQYFSPMRGMIVPDL